MIRVISSPSSSTTGLVTLIFAMSTALLSGSGLAVRAYCRASLDRRPGLLRAGSFRAEAEAAQQGRGALRGAPRVPRLVRMAVERCDLVGHRLMAGRRDQKLQHMRRWRVEDGQRPGPMFVRRVLGVKGGRHAVLLKVERQMQTGHARSDDPDRCRSHELGHTRPTSAA